MTVTREYLPGLRLAQQFIAESVSEEAASDLDCLIAQAGAARDQQPVAWLVGETVWENRSAAVRHAADRMLLVRPLYTHTDDGEAMRQQLADSHSTAGSLQDLCRFLAASYCELDELRYTTAKLPADQISDFLIGKWPVIQGTANQMNIKRISGQPYDQVGALQGIIAMLATAQSSATQTDHSVAVNKMVEGQQ